jgi:putative FmdB family regulatory protein
MPLYDARCNSCGKEYSEIRKSSEPVTTCPLCGADGRTIWKTVPILDKAKDPYDLISSGTVPDSKPIKSFAKDHRKGGKNTI